MNIEKTDIRNICLVTGMQKRLLSVDAIRNTSCKCTLIFKEGLNLRAISKAIEELIVACDALKSVILDNGLEKKLIVFLNKVYWNAIVYSDEDIRISLDKQPWVFIIDECSNKVSFAYNEIMFSKSSIRNLMKALIECYEVKNLSQLFLPCGGKNDYDKMVMKMDTNSMLTNELLEENCKTDLEEIEADQTKEYVYTGHISKAYIYTAWANVMLSLQYSTECIFGIIDCTINEQKGYVGNFSNVFPYFFKTDKEDTLSQLHEKQAYLNKYKDINAYLEAEQIEFWLNSSVEITQSISDELLEKYTLLFEQKPLENKLLVSKSNILLSVLIDENKGLRYRITWNKIQYSKECIDSIVSMFEDTLNQIEKNVQIHVADIKYNHFYDKFTKHQISKEKLFYLQDYNFGGRTAIINQATKKSYTFDEFNQQVNKISAYLKQCIYKGQEHPIIGVCMQRSYEMLVSIYAIMKSGGTYMPIEHSYPEKRIQYMMDNSKCLCVISDEANQELGYVTYNSIVEQLTEEMYDSHIYAEEENSAYLLYTSGSTGTPKGVLISHKAIQNRIDWIMRYAKIDEKDCFLFKTPYTFDVSVIEILIWKYSGCKVCILPAEEHRNPEKILNTIRENNVTIVHFVPSMLKAFSFYVESLNEKHLGDIRYIFTSGEALEQSHIQQVKHTFNTQKFSILNLYGPTEAAVDVSYYECDWGPNKVVPIGRAIDNVQLYCLDKLGRVLPTHISGQLAIAGIALLEGYLNDPVKTKEKVLHHKILNSRIYLTGDKAYYRNDGNLIFEGRIDSQVKIRGQRIELGEIKSVILDNKKIKNAQVMIVKKESPYIAAFLVARLPITEDEIIKFMKKRLAEYMVPQEIVFLEELPTNTNGKCDLKQLEKYLDKTNECVNETDEVTQKIITIWQQVIGHTITNIKANFFEVGGDSIKAIYLLTLLNTAFKETLTIDNIFENPSIELQSHLLRKDNTYQIQNEAQIEESSFEEKEYIVNATQRRMYFLSIYNPSTAYNITGVYEIQAGQLDIPKIEGIFNTLLKHHSILRTSYIFENDNVVAHVQDTCTLKIKTLNYKKDIAIDEIIDHNVTLFDYQKAPLIQVQYIKILEKQYLVIELSHIIADGISLSILMEEFKALYSNEELIAQKEIPYHTITQNALDKGAFWKNELKEIPNEIPIKEDFKRPTEFSFKGDSIFTDYDFKAIQEFAANKHVTPAAVVLSGLASVIWKLSKKDDFVIGVVTSGRSNIASQKSVGPFVNTLPIYFKFLAEQTNEEILEYVSIKLRNGLMNQDYPVDTLVETLNVDRVSGQNPIFNIMFTYISDFLKVFELPDIKLKAYPYSAKTAKVDLSLFVHESNRQMELEYCTDLFKENTIHKILKRLDRALKWIMSDKTQSISELSMLLDEELECYYSPALPYVSKKAHRLNSIQECFDEVVFKYPDRIAIKTEGKMYSYSEVNRMSNALASLLVDKGVVPLDVVGIKMRNSLEVYVAILAILKVGAAYLPIDQNVPEERTKFMLEEMNAQVLICEDDGCDYGVKDHLRRSYIKDILLKTRNFMTYKGNKADLAYIIFTSGSTGKPKGCLVTQGNVLEYIGWAIKYYFEDYDDTVYFPMFTSISVDLTVTSIFTPLLSGNTAIIYDDQLDSVYKIFSDGLSNIVKLTPSHIKLLAGFDFSKSKIRKIIVGGEQLLKSVCDLVSVRGIKFYNEYGPTEATVGCMIYEYNPENYNSKEDVIPIGKAMAHSKIYLVDKNGGLCPQNVEGEIYVGGPNITKGYTDATLTKKAFIQNPFSNHSEVIYRTGDYGYYAATGDIVYMGRSDYQKKIRGHRIELGEIESALQNSSLVHNTFVHLYKEEIVAVIIPNEQYALDKLKKHLRKWLPNYMIPTQIIEVEALPIMLSGKTDIKEIEQLIDEVSVKEDTVIEIEDDVQKFLFEVWKQLLKREDFTIYDNFFEVGGNSFLLMKVHERLKSRYTYLELMDYFKYPTIIDLALYLKEKDIQGERANFIKELRGNNEGASQYEQIGYELSEETIQSIKENAIEYACDEVELIASILYTIISESVEDSSIQMTLGCDSTVKYIYGKKSIMIEEALDVIKHANKEKIATDYISIAVRDSSDLVLTSDIIYTYDCGYGIFVKYQKERVSISKLQDLNEILMDILE